MVRYSFLNADAGYPAVWKELSRRYGDVEVMANAYLKRVLNWQPIRHDDPKALDEFSVFLKEWKTATQCTGGFGVLEYRDNLQHILRKLPPTCMTDGGELFKNVIIVGSLLSSLT